MTISVLRRRTPLSGLLLLAVVVLSLLAFATVMPRSSRAATGINEQLNYQARLLNAAGATVADGTYNMRFKIYQDGTGCESTGSSPCGGTLKWTETRESTNKVTVKNGYFSVQLGSVTPFAANVDWNQDSLWLSIDIGGTGTPTYDGEMLPFRRLSAVPYALNAKQLGGLDWSKFVQVAPAAAQIDSSTLATLFLNKTGASGNILTLQKSGTNAFVVANDGSVGLGNVTPTAAMQLDKGTATSSAIKFTAGTTTGATASDGFDVGITSAGVALVNQRENLALNFNTNNTQRLSIAGSGDITVGQSDTTGTLFVLDTKTDAGDPTGVAGGMYYNSSTKKFRCFQGLTWYNCVGSTPAGAIARTNRVNAANSAGTTAAYTPAGTFTPAADTVLVAFVGATDDLADAADMPADASSITISGGGLTWVPIQGRSREIRNEHDIAYRAFYAIVDSAPPANMQVSVDNGTFSTQFNVVVDEYTNVNTSVITAGSVTDERAAVGSTVFTSTLTEAPTTTDVVLSFSVIDEDTAPSAYDIPAGWTELSRLNYTPESQLLTRTNYTSTTLDFDLTSIDYTNADMVYGGFILKAAMAGSSGGGGGGAPTTCDANGITYICQGGNSLTGNMIIGTNNAESLEFETTAVTRMRITAGGDILIGTDDANASMVVLDTKNTAGDPTGSNGGMYYNSADHEFRGYQNGQWGSIKPVRYAFLSADRTSSSTTYADVTDLSFPVSANVNYQIDCTLTYQTAATTTGIGFALNGPASPSMVVGAMEASTSGVAASRNQFNAYNGTTKSSGVQTASANQSANLRALFRNGANSGTLSLRYASEVAASNAVVKAGSYCTLIEL